MTGRADAAALFAAALSFAGPAQAQPGGTPEAQAATFLDRLAAGQLRGARAALPADVRLGTVRQAQQIAGFRAVTQGCERGRLAVLRLNWLDPPRRGRRGASPPAAARPPARLRAGGLLILPGAPPPTGEDMALSLHWTCPSGRPNVVTYFYLRDDRIVRAAYAVPPQVAPRPGG